ncbi:MAG: D-amino-acid transaminase [Rickettsiales bacterium]|nr:D-amino-acid transaminase [Rickettsiales bacterium]
MSRTAYVDGEYVPLSHAQVNMQDRGYQFADGIYEVIARMNGCLLDGKAHLDRLERSLVELDIPMPMSRAALDITIAELLSRHKQRNGLVYMQVTRGTSKRNHVFAPDMKPVLTIAYLPSKFAGKAEREQGIKVITAPDMRWARCDIKTIALLPNIMVRNQAAKQGAKEVWQINADGYVTEGALSNAYIVDKSGVLRTHPLTHAILGGVTRDTILKHAREEGVEVKEEAFTLDEVRSAKEAFLSSCSTFVQPVSQIDDQQLPVGDVTKRLMKRYDEHNHAQMKG